MADHDTLYHLLFGHPEMVAELLTEFLGEPWVGLLDLARMERINTKLHAEIGVRRDADVIWRIPMRNGQDAYLIALIEFQSRSERFMALRSLTYTALLWQQLIREKRIPETGFLPPVLPLTLYNGDLRWAAPLSLRELIGLVPDSPLWRWQPESRYHLIDESAYATADLASRDALTALLFRIEQCVDRTEVLPIADAVVEWFDRHAGLHSLRGLFGQLIAGMCRDAGDDSPVPDDLREARSMLATRVQAWERELRQEGRQEGEAALLLRMLDRKFGPIADGVHERIAAADQAQLEAWGLRLLEASSIEELFR
jgi:hypothetical protein